MTENNDASQRKEPEILPREYQLEMLEAAKKRNIIVCLGTGTGKTFISIKLIQHLAQLDDICRPFSEGAKRTIFLVNTVPLVFQQADAIESSCSKKLKVKSYCGEMIQMDVNSRSQNDWLKDFENNHILVMTAKIYLDLLDSAKLNLSQANLLVFDECHRAKKRHEYKRIMDCFANIPEQDSHPRILGLTASVLDGKVSDHMIPKKIRELESTLRSVCITASDPNIVEKYGARPEGIPKEYSLSNDWIDDQNRKVQDQFHSIFNSLLAFLKDIKVEVIYARGSDEFLVKALAITKSGVGECLGALNDIGIWAAHEVSTMLLDELEKRNARAVTIENKVASLILQATLTSLREIAWIYQSLNPSGEEIQQQYLKPKVKKLLELFTMHDGDGSLCSIVFVQRRFAACVLSKLINTLASKENADQRHLRSDFVTGHGSDLWASAGTAMNYKKQNEKLLEFKKGSFNVLVGTSVIEEGVDIPKCNLVIMFDFPQDFRAYVQSRGRGRANAAKYVYLVENSELEEKEQKIKMYDDIDNHLKDLCQQRDRDVPTAKEASEAINKYPLPDYFTKLGAKLNMANSVESLYRYCSKLPCDRFTCLKPNFFTIRDGHGKYQCSLKMPGNCSHLTTIIEGEKMSSKSLAKEAVAREACIRLHKKGALDDHLYPVKSDSENESDDKTDGPSQPKTGTRKRKRLYVSETSKQLYGQLVTDGTKTVFVYAIRMKFDEVSSKVKKTLWDRKSVSFGIVTNEKLPELPPFSLYNVIGKLTVIFELCQSESEFELTQNQRDLIDWLHNFIFTETLQFQIGSTKNGCRVVLLKDSDSSVTSNEPSNIDFRKMELLKRNACESNGRYSRSDTDLLDSVVIKDYLPLTNPNSMRHHMVISTGGNPFSEFPDRKKAGTFKEYFETKYDLTIRDLSQPLVGVILYSREIDCRLDKVKGKKSDRDTPNEYLIPELLKFRTSPQSLTLRALFLPAILYRVNSLLSLSQLQEAVVKEMINSLCTYDTLYIPPEKKLKSSSDSENSSVGSDREGGSNQVTMVDTCQLLSKYFRPLDNSKSVPLLQLLEAVTSASAGENFNLERLEMLGDSFLKMAVSIHVYWHKHYKDEGKLTKYRQRQISNKNLFNLACKRHLPKYINHSIFTKKTWIPPGFTFFRSKGENDNYAICDVIHKDKGRVDRKGIMNLNPTDDVTQNDVTHGGAGDCEMPDDVDDDVRYDSTADNVMHGGVMQEVVSDEAVQEINSDYAKDESSTDDVIHDGAIHDATSDESVKELASVINFKHDCSTVEQYGTMHQDAADNAICKDASADSVKLDNTTDNVIHDGAVHDATSDESVKELASVVINFKHDYSTVEQYGTMHQDVADKAICKDASADSVKLDNTTDNVTHDDTMHDAIRDDHEAVKEVTSVDNLNVADKAMGKKGDNTVLDAASDTKAIKGVAKGDMKYDSSTDDVVHNDIMHESAPDKALCKTDRDDVMKQQISDKCIADSVEALIGAHFMNCGYMGALVFMTWLGLDVFHRDVPSSENEKLLDDRHRKSPLESYSKYANYPTLDIPKESAKILKQQTREMEAFEEQIGYTFRNKALLLEAFTHPTYYDNTITGSYQRLEFLGDAILDFLVTLHIFNKCESELQPGDLTDLRSALVNNNIFAVIAVENDYHKYLKEYSPELFNAIRHFVIVACDHQQNLGDKVIPDPFVIAVESDSGDVQCIEAPKPLGDVFESVAGAIFLDSGLDIIKVWRVYYPMLQKYMDEYSKKVPKNLVRRVKEHDDKAKFGPPNETKGGRVCLVLTFKGQAYEGVGRNKHNAKLSAAYKALQNI